MILQVHRGRTGNPSPDPWLARVPLPADQGGHGNIWGKECPSCPFAPVDAHFRIFRKFQQFRIRLLLFRCSRSCLFSLSAFSKKFQNFGSLKTKVPEKFFGDFQETPENKSPRKIFWGFSGNSCFSTFKPARRGEAGRSAAPPSLSFSQSRLLKMRGSEASPNRKLRGTREVKLPRLFMFHYR